MKKLVIILFLLVLFTVPVGATPFLFDVDGDGDSSNAIEVNLFQADSDEYFDAVVELGADGALGNGDVFTDNYSLNILYSENTSGSANYLFGLGTFTATMTDIKGEVKNYSNGGDGDTTASNYDPNIYNDTWDLEFYAGDEVAGTGIATITYNGVDIGTFLVQAGGTDSPFTADSNGTITGSTGITLVALELAEDYWYTTSGIDMSTLDPQSLVIGLVDSGANLEEISGDETDDTLTLTFSDNGDTIRISTVPEPATFALFGFGLLGLAAISRRKNA